MNDRYITQTFPTGWCSICGPGNCEHNAGLSIMQKHILKSFKETTAKIFGEGTQDGDGVGLIKGKTK